MRIIIISYVLFFICFIPSMILAGKKRITEKDIRLLGVSLWVIRIVAIPTLLHIACLLTEDDSYFFKVAAAIHVFFAFKYTMSAVEELMT